MGMPVDDLTAQAPDFEGVDTQGRTIRLSDFRGKNVVLVLNRGFT